VFAIEAGQGCGVEAGNLIETYEHAGDLCDRMPFRVFPDEAIIRQPDYVFQSKLFFTPI